MESQLNALPKERPEQLEEAMYRAVDRGAPAAGARRERLLAERRSVCGAVEHRATDSKEQPR